MAAAFFLSGLFTIFSPMPILLLYLGRGRAVALAAALTNLCIVWLTAGAMNAYAFLIASVVVALSLGELFSRRVHLNRAVSLTLAIMAATTALSVAAVAWRGPNGFRSSVVEQANHRIRQAVELVLTAQISNQRGTDPAAPETRPSQEEIESLREDVVTGLPSAIAIFALVLVVANAVLCLRLNPRGIRRLLEIKADFLRTWHAPEFLVWPTLLVGAASLWLSGPAGIWATGALRFLLAIYCFQGLSILAFFFDAWALRPLLRWVGFAAATFFMMPFVLSLGFFDLWFNFRSRFRPTSI